MVCLIFCTSENFQFYACYPFHSAASGSPINVYLETETNFNIGCHQENDGGSPVLPPSFRTPAPTEMATAEGISSDTYMNVGFSVELFPYTSTGNRELTNL